MQTDSGKQRFCCRCLVNHPDHISVDAGSRTTEPGWGRERWRKLIIPLSVVTAKGGLKVSARKTNWVCCLLPEPVFMSLSKTAALHWAVCLQRCVGKTEKRHPHKHKHSLHCVLAYTCIHSTRIKHNVGTLGPLGKRSSTLHALVNSLDWKKHHDNSEILNAYITVRLQLFISTLYFVIYTTYNTKKQGGCLDLTDPLCRTFHSA